MQDLMCYMYIDCIIENLFNVLPLQLVGKRRIFPIFDPYRRENGDHVKMLLNTKWIAAHFTQVCAPSNCQINDS
jgi:hypothetical protein